MSILGLLTASPAQAEPGGAPAGAVASHAAQASPACARWIAHPLEREPFALIEESGYSAAMPRPGLLDRLLRAPAWLQLMPLGRGRR